MSWDPQRHNEGTDRSGPSEMEKRRRKAFDRFRGSGELEGWLVPEIAQAARTWAQAPACVQHARLRSGRRRLCGGEDHALWAREAAWAAGVRNPPATTIHAFAAHTAGLTFGEVLEFAEAARLGFPAKRSKSWIARAVGLLDEQEHTSGSWAPQVARGAQSVARAEEALRAHEIAQQAVALTGREEHPDLDEEAHA